MPQIANQDYNVIDFSVLPRYESIERLYRAYLNGTAFDCVVRIGKRTNKIIAYEERAEDNIVYLDFKSQPSQYSYILKAPLATDGDNRLMFNDDFPTYIVSADGFYLKAVVKDGVLTGVEVTTEKIEPFEVAQYFKEWMIGQPVKGVTPK